MSDEINAQQNPGVDAPQSPEVIFSTPEPAPEEHHHLGPIIGVLIVVLVLILGGIYIWGAMLVNGPASDGQIVPRDIVNDEPETTRAEADVQIANTVSSSDEVAAIEADIESTDLDSFDAELDSLGAELDAAPQ